MILAADTCFFVKGHFPFDTKAGSFLEAGFLLLLKRSGSGPVILSHQLDLDLSAILILLSQSQPPRPWLVLYTPSVSSPTTRTWETIRSFVSYDGLVVHQPPSLSIARSAFARIDGAPPSYTAPTGLLASYSWQLVTYPPAPTIQKAIRGSFPVISVRP